MPESCPRCGATLAAGGPAGSCPSCLLQLGLETSLPPGTSLGPYEIVSRIGAGGMGEVYRARDGRLKREVAIKVLPGSFSTDPDRLRRFEKEAQAASALNHPNIMSVFDFGSHDGAPYIVSELLEGQTLRSRLADGALAPRKAIEYSAQIARGLAAAHAKGIVHRDLKPENVFVTNDEHLKILDFGLAKFTQAEGLEDPGSAWPTASEGTEPGVVLGTLSYMSPEQVKGQAIDARSDIFSFGSILYEMLSGKRAFQRGSAAETMSAILKEDPPEVSASERSVPSALDHIVRHCLEKDPGNRFQSTKDIVFSLSEPSSPLLSGTPATETSSARARKAVIVAAALVVLAVAAVLLLRRSHALVGEAGRVNRVAVLPFENLGASEDDYFADGLADAVRGKLTSLASVQVIARSSSTPYKKTTKAPRQIAQELDVGYLLTGTVRWQKGPGGVSRVEVSPELVEIRAAGAPISKWQQSFDAALTDVFQVQSDIASRVAQSMGSALGASEKSRLAETPTANLDAYDAFLKGEELSSETSNADSQRKLLAFYDRAVALDPGFSHAWARVSEVNSMLYANFSPTPLIAQRARDAAEKAIALAPNAAWGYAALGRYQGWVLQDHEKSLEQFRKARSIAPSDAAILSTMGVAEQVLGRWTVAVEDFKQAAALDPRSVRTAYIFGRALVCLRRYAEARETLGHGLALAPADLWLINWRAALALMEGDLAGARSVLSTASKSVDPSALAAWMSFDGDYIWALDERERELLLRLTPDAFDGDRGVWALSLLQGYALRGDTTNVRIYAEEARKAFEDQIRSGTQDALRHASLGLALAYLGRKSEAILEGERGVALGPVARDAIVGPYYQHCLVRIYMLVGEPEKALDHLEPLLKIPYSLSPGLLRIDPNFDPLRGNPRLQKLVEGRG